MALADFKDWLARKPAGPKPRKPLKRTRVRPVSKRRRKDGAEYSAKREAFLREQFYCEACMPLQQRVLPNRSCDVHHKAGRTGTNYLDESTWAAVCRPCHEYLHAHPSEARKLGLLK